jgi:hypothetical protein
MTWQGNSEVLENRTWNGSINLNFTTANAISLKHVMVLSCLLGT